MDFYFPKKQEKSKKCRPNSYKQNEELRAPGKRSGGG